MPSMTITPSKPITHEVTITVDANGNFSYVNPLISVNPGDIIRWVCTNEVPFAIHIGWDSPLDNFRYQSSGDPIGITVPRPSSQKPHYGFPGYFRYTVAVFDGTTIWTDDPEIIVRRSP